MKYLLSAAAALALALAGPALALDRSETDTPGQTVDEAADASQNRVVCKREKSTGSRLGSKKVCMTAAQWAQLQRDQREVIERRQAARWKSE